VFFEGVKDAGRTLIKNAIFEIKICVLFSNNNSESFVNFFKLISNCATEYIFTHWKLYILGNSKALSAFLLQAAM